MALLYYRNYFTTANSRVGDWNLFPFKPFLGKVTELLHPAIIYAKVEGASQDFEFQKSRYLEFNSLSLKSSLLGQNKGYKFRNRGKSPKIN